MADATLGEVGLTASGRMTRLEMLGLADDAHGLLDALVGLDQVEKAGVQIDRATPLPGEEGAFFGRELESDRLADAFRRSRSAGGVTLVVCGEAGIGKTALVRRFVEDLRPRGVTVAWGAGAANPRVPLGAWVDVVDHVVRADPDAVDRLDPGDRQAIAGLFGRWPGTTPPEPRASAEGGRERLFDALVHLLAAQADARPVVVVIDDVHLTPPSTRRMARRLAAANVPLLLIATVRTADPAVAGQLFDAPASNTVFPDVVFLQGLGANEIDRYLCHVAGTARVGADAQRWLLDQTGGNPLLLGEMARVLVNHGTLDPDRAFDPPRAVQHSSDALLLTRLDGLAAGTVAALDAAAVLGPRFMADDLAQLVDRAQWHLAEAVAAGLVVNGSEPGLMDFAHHLVHEAIYRTLPEGERLELHEAAGDALLQRHSEEGTPGRRGAMTDDPVFGVARHHLVAASLDPSRAVDSLRAAAETSLDRFAFEDAAVRFEEAAGVAGRYTLGPVLCCELAIGRGDALRQAGRQDCT
ncbi:MAG: AAA family ATPase, partial [Actinomycetota bacterium]|nr:AAA family ATPase [Actinomycetota bacterium]